MGWAISCQALSTSYVLGPSTIRCDPFSAWQFRQSSLVGIFRPARIAASRSIITSSSMYSLPGPWHFSHCTPSLRENVSSLSQGSASERRGVAAQAHRRLLRFHRNAAPFGNLLRLRLGQAGIRLGMPRVQPQRELISHRLAFVAFAAGFRTYVDWLPICLRSQGRRGDQWQQRQQPPQPSRSARGSPSLSRSERPTFHVPRKWPT